MFGLEGKQDFYYSGYDGLSLVSDPYLDIYTKSISSMREMGVVDPVKQLGWNTMTVTDDSRRENEIESTSAKSKKLDVHLPHTSSELEERIEKQINEYESTSGEGIVPPISARDYLIEGCIGVLLSLYLVVEVFMV